METPWMERIKVSVGHLAAFFALLTCHNSDRRAVSEPDPSSPETVSGRIIPKVAEWVLNTPRSLVGLP